MKKSLGIIAALFVGLLSTQAALADNDTLRNRQDDSSRILSVHKGTQQMRWDRDDARGNFGKNASQSGERRGDRDRWDRDDRRHDKKDRWDRDNRKHGKNDRWDRDDRRHGKKDRLDRDDRRHGKNDRRDRGDRRIGRV